MKKLPVMLMTMLLVAAMAFGMSGCDAVEDVLNEIEPPSTGSAVTQTSTPAPTQTQEPTGEKTVLVWVRDGLRNATMNGGNQLTVGVDNSVVILTGHPLWVEFDYTDSYGREQHTRIDLDDYYDYFILKENGGWSSNKYKDAYDSEKNAP